MSTTEQNLQALHRELDWLGAVISQVICRYLKQEGHEQHWTELEPPDLYASVYHDLIQNWQLNIFERLALALTLAPHLKPETLDIFFGVNQLTGRGFSEFGGLTDKTFSGFLPTGQTLIFLLSANDPDWQVEVARILSPSHRFAAEQFIRLETENNNLPRVSGALTLSEPWLHYLLTGERVRPEHSASFPASPITTTLNWEDLVLEYRVRLQIEEIRAWINHGDTLMQQWGLANKIKPGYRAVFYGPPGTGKTLTAALLAKSTGREIYRVDLSMIVSKYIGETEKNLGRVFDAASYKDWILFFDEADALFGKRTTATTSNDRHANQQTGYLLQRIEDFPGTVILATNLKSNMDEAFTRRFQSMIHFTMPSPQERRLLWRNAFHNVCELGDNVDINKIADEHELAGGAIINILRQCALTAISQNRRVVHQEDLMVGIRRELGKDHKTLRATYSPLATS